MPRGSNPKSKANLKPVKKGDAGRNPTGKNGQELRAAFRGYFMDEDVDLDDKKYAKLALETGAAAEDAWKKCKKTQRFVNILRALYRRALSGDKQAQCFITEHMIGAIPQSMEVSGPGGSQVGGGVSVVLQVPDNGRGPGSKPHTDPGDDVGDAPPPPAPDGSTDTGT